MPNNTSITRAILKKKISRLRVIFFEGTTGGVTGSGRTSTLTDFFTFAGITVIIGSITVVRQVSTSLSLPLPMLRLTIYMRLALPVCLLVILEVVISSFFFSQHSSAALLGQASISLDRLKASSPLSATICATPSSTGVGTEGKVQIVFPSDFTLSQTASAWTITTTNLPSGSTAWPGIGSTANTVLGSTVIVMSNDLTSLSKFCFKIVGSGSSTGDVGEKTFELKTLTSGNAPLDTRQFTQNIIPNDQITLSATVPAQSSDFIASLDMTSPLQNVVSQDTVLSYEITYGSHLSYPTNITVEAEWTLGTIAGSGVPTVEILDYVISSASNAYNSTPPVVDLINRKITWTILAFPAVITDEKVTFQLRTNDNYTGLSQVDFSIQARVLGPLTQTTDSTVSTGYQFDPAINATPTPTTGPTATPTPAKVVPLPNLLLTNVAIDSIAETEASLTVTTNIPSSLTIEYGTNPNRLTSKVTSLSSKSSHLIRLSDLKKSTNYYFRVTAATSGGKITTSDLFFFATASSSEFSQIDPLSLIGISGRTIFFANHLSNALDKKYVFILPINTTYSFQMKLTGQTKAKRVQAFVKSKNVLGMSSLVSKAYAATENVEPLEVEPSVFLGRVTSPVTPGNYSLMARIFDDNGSITNEEIATLKITSPFTIKNKTNGKPIENAKVTLSMYDIETKLYKKVSGQYFLNSETLASNEEGIIDQVLPQGRYHAEITSYGFKHTEHIFSIGTEKGDDYPTIFMEEAPFNLVPALFYLLDTGKDITISVDSLLGDWIRSSHFFNIINSTIALLSIVIGFLAFASKIKSPLVRLPFLLHHHSRQLVKPLQKSTRLLKIISAHSDAALPGVHVILRKSDGDVLFTGITNKNGVLTLPIILEETVTLDLIHSSYLPFQHRLKKNDFGRSEFTFAMTYQNPATTALAILKEGMATLLGRLFETILFMTVIFELLIGYFVSWERVLLFLPLSLLTVLFYIYYRHKIT